MRWLLILVFLASPAWGWDDNNRSAKQSVGLYDADGNPIDSHKSGHGGYHLGVNATISGEQNPDRHAWISALGDQIISPRYRLIGHSFSGTAKDVAFWTESGTTGTGSVTQGGGFIQVDTGTGVTGAGVYSSKRKARFVAGSPNILTAMAEWESAATPDNVRRIGCYDNNEGFFFELDGLTFSVGSRTGGVDTNITTFNGNSGTTWTPTALVAYKLDIEMLPIGTFWYVNGTLLHKSGTPNLTATLTLPVRIENVNEGNTTDVGFHSAGMLIAREGQYFTAPTSYYFASGTTTGAQLKIGAGTIHSIIFGGAANNSVVTLADSTSTSTPIIWLYQATGALDMPVSVNMGGMPFYDGLRLIVGTGNATFSVVYE